MPPSGRSSVNVCTLKLSRTAPVTVKDSRAVSVDTRSPTRMFTCRRAVRRREESARNAPGARSSTRRSASARTPRSSPSRCARWPRRSASCRPRSTGTSTRSSPSGLALVDESFVSLRAMLRDIRRGDPSYAADIVDRSVETLVEHVHQQRSHFLFIARERAAGPLSVREAIRHEIELCERELATDLARLPGTETWSAEDLRVLSNLIVTAMVATAEQIMVAAGRPGRGEADRRERPHPAPDGPRRRPQLAVARPESGGSLHIAHALRELLTPTCSAQAGPSGGGARSTAVRGSRTCQTSQTSSPTRSRAASPAEQYSEPALAGGRGGRQRSARPRRWPGARPPMDAEPPLAQTLVKGDKGKHGYRKIVVGPGEPHLLRDELTKDVRRPGPARRRGICGHSASSPTCTYGRPVAGPRRVPRPARRPGLAVRRRPPVPAAPTGPRTC